MGTPTRDSRPLVLGGVFVVLLAGIGAAWWLVRPKTVPDMTAALAANNRGVGHMERFEYEPAIADFEEVTRLAPGWTPGLINLGIARLNLAGKLGSDNVGDQSKVSAAERGYQQAAALFKQVLDREPNNPHALFCLGIIAKQRSKLQEAVGYFEAVTRIDPNDAATWYWLGNTQSENQERAAACYRKALELEPHLSPALYNLFLDLRQTDRKEADRLFAEFNALQDADAEGRTRGNLIDVKYTEMGRYGDVIGRLPPQPGDVRLGTLPLFRTDQHFAVRLAPGTRWATQRDFHGSPVEDFRADIRARFGATIVALDYDRDGKLDLLLLGAVVEKGHVRDLLLHNDGGGRFHDVTHEAGLDGVRPSLGCCVADFDNDGFPDLFVTGVGEQHLFRNAPAGKSGRRFEDTTAAMGLDQLKTVCLGATFIDLDQDGDLDLVIAQYTTTDHLGNALSGGRLAVYINVGQAPPLDQAKRSDLKAPLLNPRFVAVEDLGKKTSGMVSPRIGDLLTKPAGVVSVIAGDLDRDEDLDLFVLADGKGPEVLVNDRLLRFRHTLLPKDLATPSRWNGALVLDVNQDGKSDLLALRDGDRPLLLLNRATPGQHAAADWFEPGATNSPPLLQAHAIDLNLDGLTDVVGLSARRKPVLLQSDGERLVYRPEALGSDRDWPSDLVAVTVGDFTKHGLPDLLVWSESQGLQLRVNLGSANRGLQLELMGRRGPDDPGRMVRCNADGFGTRVQAYAGSVQTCVEYTNLSAGLGQSCAPLWLGLGPHQTADVVRLRWPDNVWQAELYQPAGPLVHLDERNRKESSCPLLFTWDGQRYVFVTDFLGAGSVGEIQPDGSCRMPRPEESVKIEPGQLRPQGGHYVLKLAEPMSEVTYLDRLRLVVVDHPADVQVYPDERFGPPATQDLLAFRQQIFPKQARDQRGRDVTATLRSWDRDTVDGFARRGWTGYAEDHWVELDFGDRLKQFGPHDRLVLALAGWTDYPYPESIWAATQAGVALQPPTLERLGAGGKWQPLIADLGFPAGLPRMMTVDVTGLLGGDRCVLRLRTNMHVYWDQVFVAPLVERVPEKNLSAERKAGSLRITCLDVHDATLSAHGCMKEYSPDGREPTVYDYDEVENVAVSPPVGRRTPHGDVTPLLRQRDDRFVIFGPGDEVTVRFDARHLPKLPAGWTRSYVLKTWGYCKDSGLFTATGATIEPLPSRAMRTYPP